MLISAEQGKILKGQVVILNERISNLQELVKQTESRDSLLAEGLRGQIKDLLDEKAIYQDQIKTFDKLLKKEKTKRRLTAAAGIVTTGAALFLSLHK